MISGSLPIDAMARMRARSQAVGLYVVTRCHGDGGRPIDDTAGIARRVDVPDHSCLRVGGQGNLVEGFAIRSRGPHRQLPGKKQRITLLPCCPGAETHRPTK